ncbi:MAG: Maf family protein [Candidatus Neomarinimicrobiota bacterium]
MKLVLASASPRRRALLARLEIPFECEAAQVTEALLPDEDPEKACLRLATAKANAIAQRHPEDLVIGADTMVVLGDQVLGKPADLEDARRMLEALSGRTHLVKTGVAMTVGDGLPPTGFVETTSVTFHTLDSGDIEEYLRLAPPLDKAGAYGIQDWSGVFVSHISGCYHNVMGFPLARFFQQLKTTGLLAELSPRNNL